jgi:Sulfotransferase family
MEKFFIVGCPRSGTTMVQQALNRHSQVAIPPETKYFFSFLGHPRRCQARHAERLNADLGIRLPTPARRVRSADDGRAFYELMARQYVRRLPKRGVTHFGEKTPEHTGLLPRVRRLFPDAKILVLYRDGRDVAHSLTQVPWMSSNLYVNFVVWLYYQWVVRRERQGAFPDVHFARYEDIVADPEKQLSAILNFLGLPYQPAVVEGYGNREGVPERELAWKGRALGRISRERVGVFRRELTTGQIEVLERLGRNVLPALGYPLLTGGERRLSPAFFIGLSYHLSRLAWRLPWRSAVRELFSRLLPGGHAEPAACAGPPEILSPSLRRRSHGLEPWSPSESRLCLPVSSP